mmetsp:Transcript_2229/g.5077  ORF Transcript_2229/g.5077 Transcript_2229/m.5077 type:complete len:127 (+) Transcript_2229:68-448(+)
MLRKSLFMEEPESDTKRQEPIFGEQVGDSPSRIFRKEADVQAETADPILASQAIDDPTRLSTPLKTGSQQTDGKPDFTLSSSFTDDPLQKVPWLEHLMPVPCHTSQASLQRGQWQVLRDTVKQNSL